MQTTTHFSHIELLFHFKKNNLFSYYLTHGFNELILQKNNDKFGRELLEYAISHDLNSLPEPSFNLEYIDKLFMPINSLNMIHFIQVLAILQNDKKKEVFQALTCNAVVYASIEEHFYYTDSQIYLNRLKFLSEVGMLYSLSHINQTIIQAILEQMEPHLKCCDDFLYHDLFCDYDEDDVMNIATFYPAFEKPFSNYLNLQDPEQKRKMIEEDIISEIKRKTSLVWQQIN